RIHVAKGTSVQDVVAAAAHRRHGWTIAASLVIAWIVARGLVLLSAILAFLLIDVGESLTEFTLLLLGQLGHEVRLFLGGLQGFVLLRGRYGIPGFLLALLLLGQLRFILGKAPAVAAQVVIELGLKDGRLSVGISGPLDEFRHFGALD